ATPREESHPIPTHRLPRRRRPTPAHRANPPRMAQPPRVLSTERSNLLTPQHTSNFFPPPAAFVNAVQPSKLQRVAPVGGAVATPKAVVGVRTYRNQGGRPALGALYSAVSAPSLALAGQPWAA